jgi:hypothetical protein
MHNLKSYIHTLLIYPLLFIFSFILKGKKDKYKNFYQSSLDNSKYEHVLSIDIKKFEFRKVIKYYFDKNSPLYDKTKIEYKLDLKIDPFHKEFGIFDFSKKIDMLHSVSMLSSRVSNDNLLFNLNISNNSIEDNNINNFLKYVYCIYFSKKVDFFSTSISDFKDENLLKAFETVSKYLEDSKILKFSNSKDLYVITCEKDKKKFDIIWLSTNREIELTDFKKVYDKFGKLLEKDIKITQSPIYAFHE